MGIDASIYSNFKAPEINIPSPLAAATQAMTLSHLGMQNQGLQLQNQQAQLQAQNQIDAKQAYADSMGADGNLDTAKYISRLGGINPSMAFQASQQANQMAEQHAKMQTAQMEAQGKIDDWLTPKLQLLNTVPPGQQSAVYHNILQQAERDKVGLPLEKAPADFSQGWLDSTLKEMGNRKFAIDNQKTQAETDKIYNEIGEVGDKRIGALKDDLDPNKARGGNLASNQKVVDSADRLGAMFKQFPDYNIPKAQQTELVSAFGSMLNGGSAPFVSQLDELVPKSARGDANAMMSWVTNSPKGADQQKFMALLKDSVDREREVAADKVKAAQVQRLSGHQLLQRTNPQAFGQVLHSYGIEPENIKDGKYVPSQQQDGQLSGTAVSGKPKSSPGFVQGGSEANASDTIAMRAPNGKIRMVPISQKAEAIAAGGSVVK